LSIKTEEQRPLNELMKNIKHPDPDDCTDRCVFDEVTVVSEGKKKRQPILSSLYVWNLKNCPKIKN